MNITTLASSRIVGNYPVPRHNVLLLTCMDLRLMDELTGFMNRDNLTNRYDHLVVAGAALGVTRKKNKTWRSVFFEHLKIAIELHKPEDIYIVEHRNCGAYAKFLGVEFGTSQAEQDRERDVHCKYTRRLTNKIHKFGRHRSKNGKTLKLNVHSFLMDLRGDVELLETAPAPT